MKPEPDSLSEEKLTTEKPSEIRTHLEKGKIAHAPLLKSDQCHEELKTTKESLIRLHAEFDNYRKRTHKEKEELVKNASATTLKNVLDIVDEFELALIGMASSNEKKGLEMLYANILSMLKREGVELMTTMDIFDPYLHECLKRESGEEGSIIGIVKKGYLFKGSILRHALVIVGNGKKEGN